MRSVTLLRPSMSERSVTEVQKQVGQDMVQLPHSTQRSPTTAQRGLSS